MKTDQIKVWTGSFGQEYNLRNIYESIDDHNQSYLDFYGKIRTTNRKIDQE